MAIDVAEFLSQPGFLAWGATNLAAAFPHGGTDLGATETGVRLHAKVGRSVLKAEEAGERVLDVLYLETELTLTAVLHQWNDRNLQLAFPGGLTTVGATTGKRVVTFPGIEKAGTRQSAHAGVLVFSPLDLASNKVLLARKAVPLLQESVELAWRLREPTRLPLVFYLLNDEAIATTDARYASRAAAVGDRTDLAV